MKLTDLEPKFMIVDIDTKIMTEVKTNEEADGIMFLCPKCFAKNNGSVGTHSVICWKPSVPQIINPAPGRWNMLGNSFKDLTFKNGSSSVALTGGCNAHFYVTDGKIQII